MSGIIDTSVFCGYWPFRNLGYRTPSELKKHLQRHQITQAWIASPEAILYPDPMEANEALFKRLRGDHFFVPVGIIDPSLKTWKRDTETCITKWRCRALKIVPNYHQIPLSDPSTQELAAFAVQLGVPLCVQIRMMDERGHHPLMKVPPVQVNELATLAQDNPRLRLLACGISHNELNLIKNLRNIWAEVSFIETGEALLGALGIINSKRLVFGSHSPFFYLGAELAKLQSIDITVSQKKLIQQANARVLLGTKPK
jgi:uncharacterized protein